MYTCKWKTLRGVNSLANRDVNMKKRSGLQGRKEPIRGAGYVQN